MIPFPKKKYQIIYADPAWTFRTYSSKGQKRSAIRHYNTLSINDICNLPISDIADNNCTLFLWANGVLHIKQLVLHGSNKT